MFEFRRQRSSQHVSSAGAPSSAAGAASARDFASKAGLSAAESASGARELPDVTGFLVVVVVTLGLFVVPVGATIMQGPAIVASILGR